jgi:hypothetical protein
MAEVDRKTHIDRTYGGDADIWVDLEVLDELTEDGEGKQRTVHKFICDKDKKKTARFSTSVRIVNPTDKTMWIDVNVWNTYATTDTVRTFNNCKPPSPSTRTWTVRKITHRGIDDKFLSGGSRDPPRDPKDYQDAIKQTGESDSDQYVCFELLSKWKETGTGKTLSYGSTSPSTVAGQNADFTTPTECKSKVIPKDSQNGKDKIPKDPKGCEGKDKVRLDPLQWIVNVQWYGGLAVKFGDKASDAVPDDDQKKNGGT